MARGLKLIAKGRSLESSRQVVLLPRNAPYLSRKIGQELDELFYQLLMTTLKLEINTNTRNQFNATFMLFKDNLYQHDKYIQHVKRSVSLKSFADNFLSTFDRDLVSNNDLKNLIINYAGIHFGMARIAHQLHQNSLKHDVVAEIVFVEEALVVIQAYAAKQHEKNFSSFAGFANILNKLVAHNIAYQTKMAELDEKFNQVSEKFNQGIMPVYASARLDMKLKAEYVLDVPSVLRNKGKRKRKTRIACIVETAILSEIDLHEPIVKLQMEYSEAEQVHYETIDIQFPKLNVSVSNDIEVPLEHPLSVSGDESQSKYRGVWDVRPVNDDVSLNENKIAVIKSRSARLFSTPSALLLGGIAGFVAGILLAPITGFSSLTLSLSMMVILAGALGSLGYLGANEIDKVVTKTRQLEINAGIASTSTITEKLDQKVESGLIAVKGQVSKIKSVASLKFFDGSSSAASSLIEQRKQLPLTFQP